MSAYINWLLAVQLLACFSGNICDGVSILFTDILIHVFFAYLHLNLGGKGCFAQNISIFPPVKKKVVPVGKATALTCMISTPDPANTVLPQWTDWKGNPILESDTGLNKPDIYVETSQQKMSQVLYISSMRHGIAGNYTCTAYYGNEKITATVGVETFVSITFVNANEHQAGTKGLDFKVMCEVEAEPPASIDWFKEGRAVFTGERYVVQPNGLLIKNLEESDDGTYSCRAVVVQTGELAERLIKVEVYTMPEMEPHDTRVVIREGESAAITCKARGHPPPRYTWVKASTKENLKITSRFSVNENTGLLNIDRVEAGDYGAYVCQAVNSAGQNETSFQVDVVVRPKIFELFNTTYPEATEGRLTCKASGRPAPQITFRKESNREPYVNGPNESGRIVIETTSREVGDQMESTAVISIAAMTRADDGLYECIATNEGGEARKKGLLTVQFKPTFENMPDYPVWSWNAQPVNITCIAESIPNATIKWKFHDEDLVQSPQVNIFGAGPISYVTVTPTDRSLYGYYKCIATNPLGEAVHTTQLRQAFPPAAIDQVRQVALTATTVTFTIFGPGEDLGPPIIAYTVQYKENGNYDWNFANNRTWSVNSPYIVENLRPMMEYDFRFAAVNLVGAGSWGSPMTIRMPKRSAPEVPQWREEISSEHLTYGRFADRYELNWKIPANNGEPIDGYEIKYCPVNVTKVSGEWRKSNQEQCTCFDLKSFDAISYELRGLDPDTPYSVELRAHNVLGHSPPASLIVKTALGVREAGYARSQFLSSGAIIGIALGFIILLALVADLSLLCCKRAGFIAWLCSRSCGRHAEDEESKLGRDEKAPLKDPADPLKRNSSIEFDGHRAYASTGGSIVGKNSAV